ncbi:MAG: prepilin peptidase [Hyphomicrobiaceae bacterium]|nr:prepilin peptidase [Hyphomicrobiaceae bacterium]
MIPVELSHGLVLAVFPFLAILAALTDTFSMTIPNRLTALVALGFFAVALASGMAFSTIGWHVLTGAGMLMVGFLLFGLGWIGGGDAKLAAGAALWLGPVYVLPFIVLMALIGGGLSAGMLGLRLSPTAEAIGHRVAFFGRLLADDVGIPYGIAIGSAALITYSHSFWIAQLTPGL